MTRPLPPDFLYLLDRKIANRPDGGTVSDTMSETLGVEKETLHAGMVGAAGVAAAVQLAKTTNPLVLAAGLAVIFLGGKALYEYLEAPRRRP